MIALNEIATILKNLFGISQNCWVKRVSTSKLNIEVCNGVAISDSTTHTCELCVALNETIFWNKNKPEYYHLHCRCKNKKVELLDVELDFPIEKITKYLFVNTNKYAMMRSMGYDTQNANEVYALVSKNIKKEFLNKNYILKPLDIHGQRIEIAYTISGKNEHRNSIYTVHTGCVVWPNGKIKITTPLILDKEI